MLPMMLVAVLVTFALLPATADSFLTAANLRTVLSNQAVIGLAALAVVPSIASGYYDLSIGANVGASAMAAAGAARAGWSMPAVIAVALLVGLTIGVINGSLVAYVHIDSLIATIGTSTVIGALVLWYSDSATIIAPFPRSVTKAVNSTWLGIPKVVWYLAVVALVVYFILDHTPLGRYFQALGSNKGAARLVGLNVPRLSVISLAITGFGAGIAGVVIAIQNGSVSPQTGPGYTLVALVCRLPRINVHPAWAVQRPRHRRRRLLRCVDCQRVDVGGRGGVGQPALQRHGTADRGRPVGRCAARSSMKAGNQT